MSSYYAFMKHEEETSQRFYSQKKCDRCNGDLGTKIMSWWVEECICDTCHTKEQPLKKELFKLGFADMLEGCGFIPEITKDGIKKPKGDGRE